MEETLLDFENVPVVWEPKEDSGTLTKEFMKMIQNKYKVKLNDFWDLHKWSIENIDKFWAEIWHIGGIIHSKPYDQVIDLSVPISEFQDWFKGAKMNFAENLLRYRDDKVALIAAGEDKETRFVTYSEMFEEVKLYAAALRKLGVKKGDVVSCYMSNREEAMFAMLATTSIGAIWVGALPLLGSQAVLNRLSQVDPVVLFTIDRFPHNREDKDMLPKLKEIAAGLPSLKKVIIVASRPDSKSKDIKEIPNSCFLDDFLKTGRETDGAVAEMDFEQVAFTHPLFISYTSGTTGLPKVLVHDSGVLLSIVRDYWISSNETDRNVCWFSMSPVGWASWNMFATMLLLGTKLVLFEGLPYFLSPTYFWDMVEDLRITHLLLVVSILDDMEKKGIVPRDGSRPVKFMMSGGSVVKYQNYDFAYQKLKAESFSSVYGSTEFLGTLLFPDQTLKLHKGEIPNPSLGVDCQCLDDKGNPVVGAIGEMVICNPVPSVVQRMWKDNDRSLLKKAYYERHPGKISVGDLAAINPYTKGILIYGRSDETLKQRGCRFGSAEIYSVVDKFPEICDSVCVAHYNKSRLERAVLFLKMNRGHAFDEDLVQRIRTSIAQELSTRHVPEVILETAEIPYNLNGKKLESIVKKIINKTPYNSDNVVNPECLENYVDLPELGDFV